MENPFAKLDASLLGNILSRCDISDIVRMRCTDRALATMLKTQSVRNKISEWRERNNEYGYSLIIFEDKNSNEISEQKAVRAREVHLIKGGNDVFMLENDAARHRRRLVLYEGGREAFKVGDLWHRDSKLPANESSVLSFAAAGDGPHNFMLMNSNLVEWKWTEHEECRFTHPWLNFTFIMNGIRRDNFMKITSLLPALPLPLRFAGAVSLQRHHVVGVELFDVKTKGLINIPPSPWTVSHVAAELKHVFEWGEGITYMVSVGDKNYGQVDLGSWKIKDMSPERLEFKVFYTNDIPAPKELDDICLRISRWLASYLLPYIYAGSTTVHFDKVEIVSSHNHDLFIVRRQKTGRGILVELWLKRENSWGRFVHLGARAAEYIVSFCLWSFDKDCILVVAKLRDVTEGTWWIVRRQRAAAVIVSQGTLQGITDGTRFSLVKHLQVT